MFVPDVFSKIIKTGGKGKMVKSEKITDSVLMAVERIARNEVEKTALGTTTECSAIYHQPKRPKKRETKYKLVHGIASGQNIFSLVA